MKRRPTPKPKKAAPKPSKPVKPAVKAAPPPAAKPARPAVKAAAVTPAAAKPAPAKPVPARPAPRVAAPVARSAAPARPAGPSLLDQAEQLRDTIQKTKLSHPDPWTYNAKARGWGERAQALVQQLADGGESPAARRGIESLTAEVEGDRDFLEARRLL